MRINLVAAVGLASVYTARSIYEATDGVDYDVFSQYNGSYLGIGFSFGWIKGFKQVASSIFFAIRCPRSAIRSRLTYYEYYVYDRRERYTEGG